MSTTDSRFRPDVIAALRDVYMHDEEIRAYLAPTIAATEPGPMHEDTAWMDRIPVQTWTTAARLWRAVRADQPDPTGRGRARVVGHDVPTWIMPDRFQQGFASFTDAACGLGSVESVRSSVVSRRRRSVCGGGRASRSRR